MTPGPVNRHEGVLGNLHLLLRGAVDSAHRVRFSRFEVFLPGDIRIQPDLLVAHTDSIVETGVVGPLTLAIEVLSRSTRIFDLGTKRELLQEAGCPHYWIVDPGRGDIGPTLIVLELVDGVYVEVARVTGDESWTATQPFAVTIVPKQLLDD